MRKNLLLTALGLAALCSASGVAAQTGQTAGRPDLPRLAKRIATTSAGIKPGDVVVIAGGKHTISLMEALAIEAQKAGGMVTMFLSSDSVTRSSYRDVPEEYLSNKPAFFAEWVRSIDVWIGLPGEEDLESLLAGIPEARVAKAAEAAQMLNRAVNESGVRAVFLGYPSRATAAVNGLPYDRFERLHWAAVGADYEAIGRQGRTVQAALRGAKQVRVTSPAGTDVSFSIGDRAVHVNDGIIDEEEAKGAVLLSRFASLPGGEVLVAPVESSANGRVVVARNRCKGAALTDVSFELKAGKMGNLKAGKGGECLRQDLGAYSGPKDVFASLHIGLNPAVQVIERGADYRPSEAAGMVYLGVGANEMLGGSNQTQGGYYFPIVGATVVADGKVVVRDGRLVGRAAAER